MTPDEPLQFDTAAPAGAPSTSCVVCKKPVGDAYYTAGKAIVCGSCKTQIETSPRPQATGTQMLRSIVFGFGGAILGAVVYCGVAALTGLEIGIVAIAVGYFVGRGVQLGAQGARGRTFQVIALLLTYLGIALGYSPEALKAFGTERPLQLIIEVLSLPVLATVGTGAGGILTGIIIAVGLRQAWVMNRDPGRPVFRGPFRVGAAA